jgi:DNA ligase (NAD+)
VIIGGATVKLATLHNEDDIRRKDIRIGDWVIVQRAGDVIPQVVGPIVSRRTGAEVEFRMPERCPVCGGNVVRPEGEAMSYCANNECPAQAARLLEHFVSRGAMDIDGVGERLAHLLYEVGLARDPGDLYSLQEDQLAALERMGEKSAQRIMRGIEASKQRTLSRVVFGLGIRHVGSEIADILAAHFRTMDGLVNADLETLTTVPGIGPTIARSVRAWFDEPRNLQLIEKLRRAGVNLVDTTEAPDGALTGLVIVVTGRLERFSRTEIEAFLKSHGAAVASDVSKRTTYLVAGSDAGSKLQRAESLGVTVLSEDGLVDLLNERGIPIPETHHGA